MSPSSDNNNKIKSSFWCFRNDLISSFFLSVSLYNTHTHSFHISAIRPSFIPLTRTTLSRCCQQPAPRASTSSSPSLSYLIILTNEQREAGWLSATVCFHLILTSHLWSCGAARCLHADNQTPLKRWVVFRCGVWQRLRSQVRLQRRWRSRSCCLCTRLTP